MFIGEAAKYLLGGIFGKDEVDRSVNDYFGGPLRAFTPWGEIFVPGEQLFSYSVVDDDWTHPRWQRPAAIHDNGYDNDFNLFSPDGKLITSDRAVIDGILFYDMVQAAMQIFLDDLRHGVSVIAALDGFSERILRARIAYSGVRTFGGMYHRRKLERRTVKRSIFRRKGVHHA